MRSLFLVASGITAVSAVEVNPIRKIVTLLQDMKKEVEAEGEKNEELYEKFMCFCKKNKGSLGESASKAQAQIDELDAKVKADSAEKSQLEADLKAHKEDRTAAKKDLATAEQLREKERKQYVADSGDQGANLAAVSKAIPALEAGMGSFLQTSSAAQLKNVITNLSESISNDDDRMTVMSFLEQSGDYAPQSGQIVGILKNMKDEMEKDLGAVNDAEKAAVKAFAELKAAKNKEIAAAGEAIESKQERAGKLAVSIVQGKAESENASEELADSVKFAAELEKNCATKEDEHKQNQKTRSEEIMAIGEAINVLNDDDALEIFNKSSAKKQNFVQTGFLQVRTSKAAKLTKARSMLASMKLEHPGMALLQSAAVSAIRMGEKSGKVDFSKVLKMIDDMVTLLGKEQKDDEASRDHCNAEFDSSADDKKKYENEVEAFASQLAELKDSIADVAGKIEATTQKIADLDQDVAEATEQRKAENSEFTTQQALNKAAVGLIFKAKNRLQKFYNPSLHVADKAHRELSQEEQIAVNNGGVDPRVAEAEQLEREEKERLAGMAFVQIRAHHQSRSTVDPPVAPEAGVGSHSNNKKSGGVVALMDMLTKEVEVSMQDAANAEKVAQRDYEELVADAKTTREQDSKSIVSMNAAKAEMEGQQDEAKTSHTLSEEALASTNTYIAELHGSCDFIIASFEERREKRTNEVEGLKNAKAVLNGADYGF